MLKGMMTPPKEVLQFLREIASKGGKERSRKLSAARRKEIAAIASKARWGKKKPEGNGQQ